jgi:hypothetical protein
MSFHIRAKNYISKKPGERCPSDFKKESAYKINSKQPEISLDFKLESRRCEYKNPITKKRCGRMTKKQLPNCWQHSMLHDKLIIKPTPGKGLGLFVCDLSKDDHDVVFKKGSYVAMYARDKYPAIGFKTVHGDFFTEKEINNKYGCLTAPYVVGIYDDQLVDTVETRSVASYANHSPRDKANTTSYWDNGTLWLRATKDIRNGDEITWDYNESDTPLKPTDRYRFKEPSFFEAKYYHTGRSESRGPRCRSRKRSPHSRRR